MFFSTNLLDGAPVWEAPRIDPVSSSRSEITDDFITATTDYVGATGIWLDGLRTGKALWLTALRKAFYSLIFPMFMLGSVLTLTAISTIGYAYEAYHCASVYPEVALMHCYLPFVRRLSDVPTSVWVWVVVTTLWGISTAYANAYAKQVESQVWHHIATQLARAGSWYLCSLGRGVCCSKTSERYLNMLTLVVRSLAVLGFIGRAFEHRSRLFLDWVLFFARAEYDISKINLPKTGLGFDQAAYVRKWGAEKWDGIKALWGPVTITQRIYARLFGWRVPLWQKAVAVYRKITVNDALFYAGHLIGAYIGHHGSAYLMSRWSPDRYHAMFGPKWSKYAKPAAPVAATPAAPVTTHVCATAAPRVDADETISLDSWFAEPGKKASSDKNGDTRMTKLAPCELCAKKDGKKRFIDIYEYGDGVYMVDEDEGVRRRFAGRKQAYDFVEERYGDEWEVRTPHNEGTVSYRPANTLSVSDVKVGTVSACGNSVTGVFVGSCFVFPRHVFGGTLVGGKETFEDICVTVGTDDYVVDAKHIYTSNTSFDSCVVPIDKMGPKGYQGGTMRRNMIAGPCPDMGDNASLTLMCIDDNGARIFDSAAIIRQDMSTRTLAGVVHKVRFYSADLRCEPGSCGAPVFARDGGVMKIVAQPLYRVDGKPNRFVSAHDTMGHALDEYDRGLMVPVSQVYSPPAGKPYLGPADSGQTLTFGTVTDAIAKSATTKKVGVKAKPAPKAGADAKRDEAGSPAASEN